MAIFRDVVVRIALALALLLPVYFLIAALGTKFGLLDWRVGFGLMTYRLGALIMIGVFLIGLASLALAFFTPPRRGLLLALPAILVPALGLGYGVYVRQHASSVPPIHDITTDPLDPPGFSAAVVDARAGVGGGNNLDLFEKRDSEGHSFIDLQHEAYPDITHVSTGLNQAQAFETALALVREQPWKLGKADAASGVIEATAESFWFGFKDDIAVRVRPDGSGARIDMRSVSRVGRSDLGANAARMEPFLATLKTRLESAEAAAGPASAPAPAADAAAPAILDEGPPGFPATP